MVADADPLSDSVSAPEAETAGTAPLEGGSGTAGWLREHQDLLATAILFAAAFAIRRPLYMMRHVFWLDEAWLADSVRAPLRALPHLTSVTPIGFTVLLRLVPPIGGPERIRLVPLLFSAGVAPLAYALGRTLDPSSRWRAWALGIAGVLLPVTLRHDLKPYTADAFFTLLLVLLVARVERGWSPRRLVALTLVACVAPLFSHPSILIALPAFGLLAGTLLARGLRRPAAWTAGAAAVTAVAFAGVYLAFDAPHRGATLAHFWDPFYVPIDRGVGPALSAVHARWGVFLDQTGLDGQVVTALLLVLGCVVLVRLGQWTLGALLPVLLIESVVIASLKLYPLWDRRTSIYLVAFATTVGVIGLLYPTALFPRDAYRRMAAVVTVLASIIAIGLVARSATERWATPIPNEDTRSAAAYIAQNRLPGDVVLVDRYSMFGFAFYWHGDQQRFAKTTSMVGYEPVFDARAGIDIRSGLRSAGLEADVRRSARRAAGHSLWIVVTREPQRVVDAYLAASRRVGTVTVVSNELIHVAVPARGGRGP